MVLDSLAPDGGVFGFQVKKRVWIIQVIQGVYCGSITKANVKMLAKGSRHVSDIKGGDHVTYETLLDRRPTLRPTLCKSYNIPL